LSPETEQEKGKLLLEKPREEWTLEDIGWAIARIREWQGGDLCLVYGLLKWELAQALNWKKQQPAASPQAAWNREDTP
jgi:hypothetical protein